MINKKIYFKKLDDGVRKERKIIEELSSLLIYSKKNVNDEEKRMISSQIKELQIALRKTSKEILESAESISLTKPLPQQVQKAPLAQQTTPKIQPQTIQPPPQIKTSSKKKYVVTPLEKLTLKRLKKKKKKIVKKKDKKANPYVKLSSKFFYNSSMSLIKKGKFKSLRRDLIKANLEFVPANYVSVIFFTTLLSFIAGIFILVFFLFFNVIALPPFITSVTENFGARLLKVFWIPFLIPVSIFLIAYIYPSLEKKSIETRINQELPFATVHMSAISGSMIDPTKIFEIIIITKEYPYLQKEFTKLLNDINIYGYDLVTALRNRAFNSPGMRLSELFNGLATTINSGGDLPEFFDKRAQTLLFEHKLEKEKRSKAAETFMDIYISVVIAAPMILMLLLMMMRVSGLGVTLSTSMITLIMVLGVSTVNVLFLTFLHLKQPEGA